MHARKCWELIAIAEADTDRWIRVGVLSTESCR